jgi:hypothetical protein
MEFAFPTKGKPPDRFSELMTPVGAVMRGQEFYYAQSYLGQP